MPWAKFGDNSATYPKLMSAAAVEGADERILNELAGWLARISTQSAMHMTDYRVDMGTATMIAGFTRILPLVEVAEKVGLVTRETENGVEYLIVVQDSEFISIQLRAEVEARRQHDRDAKNVLLMTPVRARDGDQCRYCQVVVVWSGPKANPRMATVDHRDPDKAGITTPDDVAIACLSCNSGRRDAREEWDRAHPLVPVPDEPIYSQATANFLTRNGIPTAPNVAAPGRRRRPTDQQNAAPEGQQFASPGSPTKEEAPSDPAVARQRPDTAPKQGERPEAPRSRSGGRSTGESGGESRDCSHTSREPSSDFEGRTSELSGSGRVGSGLGRDGSVSGRGMGGSGRDRDGTYRRRRRGKRGGSSDKALRRGDDD